MITGRELAEAPALQPLVLQSCSFARSSAVRLETLSVLWFGFARLFTFPRSQLRIFVQPRRIIVQP